MNIERAFRRRDDLRRRLKRVETMDLLAPSPYEYTRSCPGSVYGDHGTPDWKGECPYCGKQLGRGPRPATPPPRPDVDVEDVIDAVTLEPVDPQERGDWPHVGERRMRR